MKKPPDKDLAYQTGIFRYGVIADLLARPRSRGELADALRAIATKEHVQPWNGETTTMTTRTLERWLACARGAERPAEVLQPKLRSDLGTSRVVEQKHREFLAEYRRAEPSWSVQLLFDNLGAQFDEDGPSYSSILRYEAQETPDEVLSELRLLSSVNLDSKTILAVVLAGDSRLPTKLRSTALLPLESRIRVRHHLDERPQDEMAHILSELLVHAGAETLLTPGVIKTMAELAMGNLRAMMMMGNELLAAGAQRQTRVLDEDLFFEVFKESIKKKRGAK